MQCELETIIEREEAPYHPLYRVLIVANALYSPSRADSLPASARRIPQQITLLEILKEKQSLPRDELLSLCNGSRLQIYRDLMPLIRIGLIRKRKIVERDSTKGRPMISRTVYQIDNSVELDMHEESLRVKAWIDQVEPHQKMAELVETPLGIVKVYPTTESK